MEKKTTQNKPQHFLSFRCLNAGEDKYLHGKLEFCKSLANACWPSKPLNLVFISKQ